MYIYTCIHVYSRCFYPRYIAVTKIQTLYMTREEILKLLYFFSLTDALPRHLPAHYCICNNILMFLMFPN